MTLTDYQAKYLTYELTRQGPSDSLDRPAVTTLGQQEEYIVLSGIADNGDILEDDTLRRRLRFPAAVNAPNPESVILTQSETKGKNPPAKPIDRRSISGGEDLVSSPDPVSARPSIHTSVGEGLRPHETTSTASVQAAMPSRHATTERLDEIALQRRQQLIEHIGTRNLTYFNQESEKLDQWADDLKDGLEREIKDLDRQIREAKKEAKSALTLAAKLEGQKRVKTLETTRKKKRQSLFEAQDEIDERCDALIAEIESRLEQDTTVERLFCVRWKLTG